MPESGYRESSRPPEDGILGTLEQLLELEARPIAPANATALAQVRRSLDPKRARADGEGLEAQDYRFVGVWSEAVGDAPAVEFDAWVRNDRTAYALVRRNELALFVDAYRVRSYFTDGTLLETRPEPPHSDVAHDVTVHDEALRAKVTEELRVIPVSGPDEIDRLERFRVTHVIRGEAANQLARIRPTQRWVLLFAIVLGAAFVWAMCTEPDRHKRPAVMPSWDMPSGDAGGD